MEKIKANKRFSHVPVIIYSTSINVIEREHCLQLGAYAYVTKPLSFTEGIDIARGFLAVANSTAHTFPLFNKADQ
jgi:CheY-like chemotaxis protein